MEIVQKFTEIFTDLFENKNLSKSEFARQVSIDHSQVTDYLNGSIPSTYTALKLCTYFQCSMDYLTGLSEKKIYPNLVQNIDSKKFMPEYERLLKENKTNHFQLSKLGVVCESSLAYWKSGHLPQFEVLINIAYELGGSIDRLLGRI